MDFEIMTSPAGLRVALRGRLTFTENETFRHLLDRLSAAPVTARSVELDLGGVDFIDSAGLGLLLHTRDTLCGREVHLAGAIGQVGRMLSLARFEQVFRVSAPSPRRAM